MLPMGAPSRVIVCALVVWLAACLESNVIECGDGRVCPSGTICHEERGLCLRPDQVEECVDKMDGEDCFAGDQDLPGTCQDGLCIVTVVECGNGVVEEGEACDDGNTDADDDCRDDCLSDYSCGNGILDSTAGEDCDCGLDGDNLPGSCLSVNSESDGADCNPDCTLHCGDGRVDLTAEACDPASPLPPPGLSCLDVGYDVGLLACSGLCTLDISDCDRLGWINQSVDGATPNEPFYAIFATSEDHVLVGGQGGLYHRGATGFEPFEGAPYTDIKAIWAASPTDVFLVAWNGQIHRYDGNTFEPQLPQPNEGESIGYMNDIWGSGPNDVYAAGRDVDHPTILHWDGDDWTIAWEKAETVDNEHVTAVFGTSDTNVWAVTNQGDILHKTTGGFVDTGENDAILRIWGAADDDLWGVGLGIYHSTGGSWNLINDVPQDTILRGVWGSDEDNVFAVGFDGTILHYDGHAWTRMRSPTARDLFAVWGNDRGDVYAAGEFGTLLHFTGAGWSELEPTGVDTLEAVWGSDPWNVYVGGGTLGAYQLVRFDGEGFTVVASGNVGQQTITSIHGAGEDDIFAVGLGTGSTGVALRYGGVSWAADALTWGGTDVWATGVGHQAIATVFTEFDVYRYPGSGSTWSPEAVPGQTLQSVFGLSPTDVFATGLFEMLHWNGSAWAQQTTPSGYWWDVWAAASDDVWAVGDGIIHYDGATWSLVDLPFQPDLRSVAGTGPDDVFAAGDVGMLMHWDGNSWVEVRTGTTENITGVWPFPEAVYLALANGTLMRLVRSNGMSF